MAERSVSPLNVPGKHTGAPCAGSIADATNNLQYQALSCLLSVPGGKTSLFHESGLDMIDIIETLQAPYVVTSEP
jgi:hypothetical protein